MRKPLLSVCLITYNHEQFIRQAIEGVLMQKVDFDWELIIAEDCSTDSTRAIILEYKEKYPDFVKLILQEKNVGAAKNWLDLMAVPRSKYVAYFEGDDYWTDPLKLQKQVDFLEANPEYVMCTHTAEEKNEITNSSIIFPNIKDDTAKYIEDYIINNLTATCSLMFKAEYLEPIPKWFNEILFGDLALMLLIFYRSNKKMMILKDCMGVYRVNSGSVHGSFKNNKASLIKAYKMHLDFINTIDRELFLKKNFKQSVIKKKINTHSILANLYKKTNIVNYCKHLLKKHLLIRFARVV
ncbi:glycosyltransferase involved in cell wall biosynthesis [Flavobacterium sp. 103]|uniref:glycosyltransferase n=1 Tax=Flavobacterium sp. 103 TaxID=2135624 RepID=UPI000D5F4343|nr:glycosyltransferase [Flavobacterium sp. 103]PVX46615.1 glycosyltransferase involved in cell wall biosynthesis [Flavobacterium sp. 103]